jgi:type IV pilus biogenesis protein CpaD/CtpE
MSMPIKRIAALAVMLSLTACVNPGVVRSPAFAPADLRKAERHASLDARDLVSARSDRLPRRLEAVVTGNGQWAVDEVYVIVRPTGDVPAAWRQDAISALVALGVPPTRIRQAPSQGAGLRVDLHVYRFVTRAGHPCEPLMQSFDEAPTFADAPFGTLGCANEANLRAMVAYPRDLRWQPARPWNQGARAAWPVDRYLGPPQDKTE